MKASTIVMMAGGAVAVACLFFAWGVFSVYESSPIEYNSWEMREIFTDSDSAVSKIATFAPPFIFVFGVGMIIEPIIGELKPEAYRDSFGKWMIFNGVVILGFTVIALFAVGDQPAIDIGYALYLEFAAAAIVLFGAYLDRKATV